jgi:ribosomal protein S12 methylthiotransferase
MPTQAPEIDGVTLINDFEGSEPRAGQIRRLRITEAHDYDLVGTLLPGGGDAGGALWAPRDAETNLIQITA